MTGRIAEVGYSRDLHRIEVTVPHGTKSANLSEIMGILFSKGIIGKLPRGCSACTSGDHLLIREQLEQVIKVDLDKKVVVGS